MAKKTLGPTEYEECKAFWQYICLKGLSDLFIKHANERTDSPWFIKALYAIGFKKGIPDYQFIRKNAKYSTLWLEIKRISERNKQKRDEQSTWLDRLNVEGHYAAYAHGADEAIKLLEDYLNNKL